MFVHEKKNLVTALMALAGARAACRVLAPVEITAADDSRRLLLTFVEEFQEVIRKAIEEDTGEAFTGVVRYTQAAQTHTMHVPTSRLATEMLPVLTEGVTL